MYRFLLEEALRCISTLKFAVKCYVKTSVIILGTYNSWIYSMVGIFVNGSVRMGLKLADLISADVLLRLLRREHKNALIC